MNGQRGYEQVLADAVRVLTEAARATSTWTDRDGRECQQRVDFAEFVTLAVAGAAANLGGIEQVLAGRPGSWEADYLRQMLTSTVGDGEQDLLAHRSEPLTVPVAVDNLLTWLGYADLFDQAHDQLEDREQAILATAPRDGPLIVIDDLPAHQQRALEEIAELGRALERLRVADWTAYGEAFRANVLAAAEQLLPRLRVAVQVEVHLDWHDDEHDTDDDGPWGPAERLWELAVERTPLPGCGMRPGDYPPGVDIAQVERDAGRDPLTRLRRREAEP